MSEGTVAASIGDDNLRSRIKARLRDAPFEKDDTSTFPSELVELMRDMAPLDLGKVSELRAEFGIEERFIIAKAILSKIPYEPGRAPSPEPHDVDREVARIRQKRPKNSAKWRCPECGAIGSYRRHELLYEQETHSVATRTTGVGVGVGSGGLGIGVGAGQTRGLQQSALAERVEPPKPMEGFMPGFGTALVSAIAYFAGNWLFSSLAGIVLAIIAGALIWTVEATSARNYNKTIYPIELEKWKNKYLCTACGHERSA